MIPLPTTDSEKMNPNTKTKIAERPGFISRTYGLRMSLCAAVMLLAAIAIPSRTARATMATPNPVLRTDVGQRTAVLAMQRTSGSSVLGSAAEKAKVVAAQKFGDSLSKSKWVDALGPLAPIALSPFFGITCLSGMALYGAEHVSPDNPFLGEGSALRNPALFWTFLFLTILTSLPRLTKVSKPFAQAMDQFETWAAVVTLLVLKVMSGSEPTPEPDALVLQAGVFSFTVESLLMIASVINIIVINMVKFFFEVLIWITPMPFLDAVFEVANKSLCAGLMAVYAWSPTVATVINLLIFAACLLVFNWVKRREVFFRSVIVDPILSLIFKGRARPKDSRLTVFPKRAFGPFKTRAKCELQPTESGWKIVQRRLLRSPIVLEVDRSACDAVLKPGFFTNAVVFSGNPTADLSFSQRYKSALPELASQLQVTLAKAPARADQPSRVEFA